MLTGPFDGFDALVGRRFLTEGIGPSDGTGVYALFLRDATPWLRATWYDPQSEGSPLELCGYTHMYTGESFGVRSRVADHLRGHIRTSNFRENVMAALLPTGWLGPTDQPIDVAECEAWLTQWLSKRVLVAFRLSGCVKDVEREILRATPSPMNIEGRGGSAYAASLKALRREFRARPEVVEWRRAAPVPSFAASGLVSRRPRR